MTTNYHLNYAGVDIPFVSDFSAGRPVMVNATKMLQCFPGKKMNHFLSNQSTKDYINALSCVTGKPVSELLIVRQGGNDLSATGTWMHKNLAIEFARWLNPSFAIWCNRRIKELLANRAVTLKNNIFQLQQANSKLEQDNNQLEQSCRMMKPYADYGNELLTSSKMTYSTSRILKECSCKISIQEVFKRLVDEGYVGRYRNSNSWFLKVPYGRKRSYTTLVSKVVNDKNGQPDHTVNQVRWTESGRLFLRSVLSDWRVI